MNVVFDVAGVLLRWQPHEILRASLKSRSLDDAGARDWVLHFFENWGGDWGSFDRGMVEPEELAQRIARRTQLPLAEVQAVIDGIPDVLHPMEETLAVVDQLRERGRALYYLSNMPASYADTIRRTRAVVFDRFDDGIFSAHVRMIKPERAIFEHAARRFGIQPQHSVFVDDAPGNVMAAREAGWHAVHFEDGAQCARELAALGAL